MTKWFSSLLLLSSAMLPTAVSAWGNADYVAPPLQTPPNPSIPSAVSFPLNADQQWFVKSSLLVWRPYQDDIDSGYTLTSDSNNPVISTSKTQNIDFNWGTGARVGIGRYLPHHEQWDVTLTSTFLYSSADKDIKGKANIDSISDLTNAQTKLITDGWNPTLLGVSLKTKLNWQINYFTWDLGVGRLYSLTPKFIVHPYLNLRALLIYENYKNSNNSVAVNTELSTYLKKTYFKATNNTWGLGPRIGSDFAFYFGKGWSFIGNLAGSIVMGRYNIQQRLNGFLLKTGETASIPARLSISDGDSAIKANLEGSLGLGWEKWVRKHSVRIVPSFLFEVSQWFLINNWAATHIAGQSSTPSNPDWGMVSSRRMGDLGFLGFTVNLQVDF